MRNDSRTPTNKARLILTNPRGVWRGWSICIIILLFASPVWAGVPVVSDILVTDATDRSFSVVWSSSEASTASLNVFNGPACTTPTAGVTLVSHPVLDPTPATKTAIKTAAENNGILKVQVSGLTAATAYCVQTVTTSKSTADQTVAPATPINVTTETQITRTRTASPSPDLLPFSNDVLTYLVYSPDQVTAVSGGIVAIESFDQSSRPATGFVGDGTASPLTLTDLNNLYDKVTHNTINLVGGERLRVLEYRGTLGCRLEHFRKAPTDLELAEIKAPAACFDPADLDCNDTINILDILRVVGGFGRKVGDFCYNPDWDLVSSGNINILDILNAVGKFGRVKPP